MPVHTGLRRGVEKRNAGGGVYVKPHDKKTPIKLVAYDDQSNTATAATLYNQLITQDKVDILVADSGSVLTSVAVPIAREHKMLLIDQTGTGAAFAFIPVSIAAGRRFRTLSCHTPAVTAAPPQLRTPVISKDQAIQDTVLAWAQAWSDKDYAAYSSFYAESYQPRAGRSRAQWEALRRQRLERPKWIKVVLSDIRIKPIGTNEAHVTFIPDYASN